MPVNQLANTRRRVQRAKGQTVLGCPPKRMRHAVLQTRYMMRQLTELVCKVHGETSIFHLGVIAEWAEYEVTRRASWMEWRENYDLLSPDQRCLLRRDTQKAAEGKTRCLRELGLDLDKMDAYAAALADDPLPTIETTDQSLPGDGTDREFDGGDAGLDVDLLKPSGNGRAV